MNDVSPHCRGCKAPLSYTLVDLGLQPLANSYLADLPSAQQEKSFPLHSYVCQQCWLIQVPEQQSPDFIFSDYAYLSSFSESWQKHCANFARQAIERLSLSPSSFVVEVASNDGTLLQHFIKAGIPALGIEPAANIAKLANQNGVPTESVFFNRDNARKIAQEHGKADLIAADNVLAHVSDIHNFINGFTELLKPEGYISFEFPHAVQMLKHGQFDTIYHEHFSYLSLIAIQPILQAHGLQMVQIETLPTHGGSLRVWVQHQAAAKPDETVEEMLQHERDFGLTSAATYRSFATQAETIKTTLRETLQSYKAQGKKVAAYGAPAKGNTLLNYCKIGTDLIAYTVDKNPVKQGKLLPGSHIPIHAPQYLLQDKPDYVLILPWNIADEITEQMQAIRDWGGKFLIAIPQVKTL